MTLPVKFTSEMLARVDCVNIDALCCLCDLLKRDKRISVGTTTKKWWCLCEFLREAMKRFLREHQTGDIFEFITSTVV